MKVEVLGVYGGQSSSHNVTGFFVDDFLALDAGCLTSSLSLDRQVLVSDVLISHSHIDHIGTLPLLVDNLFDKINGPLNVWAHRFVLDALHTHIFNGIIWPDFTQLPTPEKPIIRIHPIESEKPFTLRHLTITPVKVAHTVPCHAFFITCGHSGRTLLYTADTTQTERIWAMANEVVDLGGVIVDCSFPNRMEALARKSGHLTPGLLAEELKKLKRSCPIYVYHIKPMFQDEMTQELKALQLPNLHFGQEQTELRI